MIAKRYALRARERAFALLGLRELEPGLWVRPDNLAGGVERTRERLQDLGLEPSAAVMRITDLDNKREHIARNLWQDEALEVEYERLRQQLQESMARLPTLETNEAARESYLLGDSAIKRLVFDLLLPEPLVDTACRRRFREAMLSYQRAGQRAWQPILSPLA
ncbi:PaaX family transcriptional regulator C-terminal domain-containing protein [Halopseudomonas maritima]|uniref:PaaX family transcriptional regulator C-terminal domain-containing protein n=1 Tax=Halopseudomonas maritima TaxID=2918528 RepID=UPI001EEC5EEA|nr:PaaX family transcriptional regulator C-terminal domain-containing protein [Halopseudomonas maritima]